MTHFSISLSHCSMSAMDRPARAAPAEKGRTGATPPFLPLYRQTGRGGVTGGVTSPTPLFRGRSRSIYPCGKAPNKAPDTDDKRTLTRRRQAP